MESRDMSGEVLPGEAMGSSDELPVVVPLQTPSGFHTADKHAVTNPWACRDAAAKENGYAIHCEMETCKDNAASGGFGAVHMAQKVPLLSGEEASDMSGCSPPERPHCPVHGDDNLCEQCPTCQAVFGHLEAVNGRAAREGPLTQAEEEPDVPGLVAARLVGGSRVAGIRGPSSTSKGRWLYCTWFESGHSAGEPHSFVVDLQGPSRAFVPRRRRDLRAGMQPASLAACEPDAGPDRAEIFGQSGCATSGPLSTTAPNSGGRAGSPDIGTNPAVISARVGREVARRKLARGIVDPSVPLAKGDEAPLGPDSTEPLLAIKSGIADKEYVQDERKHWLLVSEAKHPNINNLIDSFTSTIPAHAGKVKGEWKVLDEKPAVHFVTPWAPHDLHDYIRKGHSGHDGQITREQMTKIAYDVAVALHHMHKNCGVAHRDLKPGNILMTDAGVAQVTDFGLAAEPNITAQALSSGLRCHPRCLGKHHFPNHLGTAHYGSPQQISYRLRVLERIQGPDEDPDYPRTGKKNRRSNNQSSDRGKVSGLYRTSERS